MRACHLYAARSANPKTLVTGINAANPVTSLRETQGDTLTVYVHEVQPNTAQPPVTTFVERPLVATAVRASIGYIDRAPESGTFRLKVGANTTTELTWPSDLSTDELITAWKAEVLAALNALAGDQGDARLDDPAGTPAHIFYFTWLDETRTDEIEVVSNRLIPWIEPTVVGSAIPVGYTQMVKLARFPVKMSGTFAQATTPPASIIESRPGAAGTNAEQTLIIPVAAAGSFSLQWDGASTKTMAVATVTAESLADALNAKVSDGESNPSFRVETRASREGKRFAIEFIGPLAEAAQDLLVVAMHDQQGAPFWSGTLELDGLGLEMALNGAEEVTLTFELVITAEGEETYLLPIVIENDMTDEGTLTSAEEAGAVYERTVTVNVPVGESEAIATVSAGNAFDFAELTAAQSYNLEHGRGSRHVFVRVSHRTDDSPEKWTDLPHGEWTFKATTANAITLTFAAALVDDDEESYWFRERFKVFIYSPDAIVELLTHTHEIAEILGLQAALDAITAALGMVAGSLKVKAVNIDGRISSSQIDIDSFITAISSAVANNATTQAVWNAMLQSAVNNAAFLAKFVSYFTTDPAALDAMRKLMLEVLSSSTGNGPLVTVNGIPSRTLVYPPKSIFIGPPVKTTVSGTIEDTTTTGLKFTYVGTKEIETSQTIPIYAPLSLAIASGSLTAGTDATAITLTPEDYASGAGLIRTVVGDAVRIAAHAGFDELHCSAGDKLTWANDHWYRLRLVGSTYFPADSEDTLFQTQRSVDSLGVGKRWQIAFTIGVRLDSFDGAVTGTGYLVVESAPMPATGTALLDSLTWTERARYHTLPGAGTELVRGSVKIDVTTGPAFAASATIGNVTATWTPASGNIAIRVRFVEFDPGPAPTTHPLALYGSLTVDCQDPTNSIVEI